MLAAELAGATLAVLAAAELTTVVGGGEVDVSALPAPPPQAVNQALDTNTKLNLKNVNN